MIVQIRQNLLFGKKVLKYPCVYDIIAITAYTLDSIYRRETIMKHIQTINKANLKESAQKGGCGKCQASCQSACKTSCTVANQKCER